MMPAPCGLIAAPTINAGLLLRFSHISCEKQDNSASAETRITKEESASRWRRGNAWVLVASKRTITVMLVSTVQ
jgi:hypothetical protein